MEIKINAKNLNDIAMKAQEKKRCELIKCVESYAAELINEIDSKAVVAAEHGEVNTRISLVSTISKQPDGFKDLLVSILVSHYQALGFHTRLDSGRIFSIYWNDLHKVSEESIESEDLGSDENENEKIDGD